MTTIMVKVKSLGTGHCEIGAYKQKDNEDEDERRVSNVILLGLQVVLDQIVEIESLNHSTSVVENPSEELVARIKEHFDGRVE